MKVKNKVKERKDSNERERESFFCCGRSALLKESVRLCEGKKGI